MKYIDTISNPGKSRLDLAVLVAHGGVGDFLFQLDLAKRLEVAGVRSIFLARSNYVFLRNILTASDVERAHVARADGLHYLSAIGRIFLTTPFLRTAIINSFNPTFFRLPTRLFYAVARLLSARVLVCVHSPAVRAPYEQLAYIEHEMIWQRNERIVTYFLGTPTGNGFPAITFKRDAVQEPEGYLHIHPVGSVLQKSYPPKKLLSVLRQLGDSPRILLTMTPSAEVWYMTDELRQYIASHQNVTFISKTFSFTEICGYIAKSLTFCTVNTGLLWTALMLRKRVIVCDTYTDYEWNPSPYENVTRLTHDYDEHGRSLHLVLGKHDDGTYFESMYRVEPERVVEALMRVSQ